MRIPKWGFWRQETVEHGEIVTGRARSAMEQQHLELRIVADPLDPDMKVALGSFDRNQPRASRLAVRVRLVVEIGDGRVGGIALRVGIAGTEAERQRQSDHDAFHGLASSPGKVANAKGRLAVPAKQVNMRA